MRRGGGGGVCVLCVVGWVCVSVSLSVRAIHRERERERERAILLLYGWCGGYARRRWRTGIRRRLPTDEER